MDAPASFCMQNGLRKKCFSGVVQEDVPWYPMRIAFGMITSSAGDFLASGGRNHANTHCWSWHHRLTVRGKTRSCRHEVTMLARV